LKLYSWIYRSPTMIIELKAPVSHAELLVRCRIRQVSDEETTIALSGLTFAPRRTSV